MSTRRISELDPYITSHKKSSHKSNESPELDVFEAAGYFSGYNEIFAEKRGRQGGRISLDIMPSMKNHHQQQQQQQPNYGCSMLDQKKQPINNSSSNIKEKKYKQPSSPGGRLASFLNSLFSQSSSKKKKSKSTSSTTQSMRDHHELDHESPGGIRRKRRSSISHFRSSISTTSDSKSSTLYSSSSSGFRTPPPYNNHLSLQTPTKNYKELFPVSFSKYTSGSGSGNGNGNGNTSSTGQVRPLAQLANHDHNILDDDQKKSNKVKEFKFGKGYSDKSPSGKKESRKKLNEIHDDQIEYDDGGESDSSSDLFELQIYDLDYYSSGLPVYETTNMDSIKRGAPIPING